MIAKIVTDVKAIFQDNVSCLPVAAEDVAPDTAQTTAYAKSWTTSSTTIGRRSISNRCQLCRPAQRPFNATRMPTLLGRIIIPPAL
ncbi:hypothetical protein V3C99_018118 [Haemonchus contortus]|uniref:Transcriptional regulator n=1 Tax=Haemonchus contortus TaxID=6289 RepID=A0A7I4Z5V5_HAECO